MQDSLYINSKTLLRTHNTGFTARELEKNPNKAFSHFTIGKVYRNDKDDSIHSHQFMQVDILNVGNISFSNLI
jgi:phenylalanyl-tRNA synthetase alpha chain